MKYYFIDSEIYYQGKKQPERKVELFNVDKVNVYDKTYYDGYDKDGNAYRILDKNIIMEEI